MNAGEISEMVKQFIIKNIDSAELLEVLLHLRAKKDQWLTAAEVANELRVNPRSVNERLERLQKLALLETQNQAEFRFGPKDPKLSQVVDALADEYRTKKHKVLDLIFSR